MVIKVVSEELIDEAIKTLTGEEQKIAYEFNSLAKEINLKISMRRNLQKAGRSYYIEYSAKKPSRKLFTLKIRVRNDIMKPEFIVKANLFHIDVYRKFIESCTDNIKSVIKSTDSCGKCNPVCYSVKSTYTLDGVLYDPCYIKGHHFKDLTSSEWETLRNLVIEEYKSYSIV